jgi:hypothetical protein
VHYSTLDYPVLIWGKDYVFLAKNRKAYERTPRSQFERLREQARAGKTKLLDSSGMLFQVTDKTVISSQHPVLSWFGEFRTAPVLSEGRKLDLDEFKSHIQRAIRARQRGEYDSDFIAELTAKLPSASNYREALACVPKGM